MGFKFGQRRVADRMAQQNFEQLEGRLDELAALELVGGAPRKVEFGTGLIFFNGAAQSNAVTINHNLGVPPLGVVATAAFSSQVVGISVTGSLTSTSFELIAATIQGVAIGPGDLPFYWVAFG